MWAKNIAPPLDGKMPCRLSWQMGMEVPMRPQRPDYLAVADRRILAAYAWWDRMRGARPRRKWGGPMMRPPQTSTNLNGGGASSRSSPHTSVSEAVGRATPRSGTVRLPTSGRAGAD